MRQKGRLCGQKQETKWNLQFCCQIDRFHCIALVKTIFFPNFLRENAYIPHVAFRICCVSKVLLVLKGKAL